MREFKKETGKSIQLTDTWIDEDECVQAALRLSLKAAGNDNLESEIVENMSLQEIGIFQADVTIMGGKITIEQQKKTLPIMREVSELRGQVNSQTNEAQQELLKNLIMSISSMSQQQPDSELTNSTEQPLT
jgi:hypothetical protein